MPICTHCTQPVSTLYTTYASASNLRLEQCPACRAFADPYVEHDALTLFIDLVLLKRDVYRHLLFNRGLGARKASDDADSAEAKRDLDETRQKWRRSRRNLIVQLGLTLIAVDTFVRWIYFRPPFPPETPAHRGLDTWSQEAAVSFVRVFIGCALETIAFHFGIVAASFVVLSSLAWARKRIVAKTIHSTGSMDQFHYTQIPLALLYSSLPKLFLLTLLSLWRPVMPKISEELQATGVSLINEAITQGSLRPLSNILDDDIFDREWVVRNVLGGMAAGFGLRVVLDCHPLFTSLVILIGWALKTLTSALISGWVGGDVTRGEAWFAYSIP